MQACCWHLLLLLLLLVVMVVGVKAVKKKNNKKQQQMKKLGIVATSTKAPGAYGMAAVVGATKPRAHGSWGSFRFYSNRMPLQQLHMQIVHQEPTTHDLA